MTRSTFIGFAICAALVFGMAMANAPAQNFIVSGQADVIDGDTIAIGNVRIRLWGMDAPEIRQTCTDAQSRTYGCGSLAADVLTEEIGSARVSCAKIDTDRYDRVVALCSVNGRDLGDAMVRRGYAVDYAHYSNGRYAAAEREAREAKRGMWAGAFENPAEWRHAKDKRR